MLRPGFITPKLHWAPLVLAATALIIWLLTSSIHAAGRTYYVSSSDGSDANDGLSAATPLKTIARVNLLTLAPGDAVRFKCGDVWRGEMLRVTQSGVEGAPITYGAYPAADCANRPIISGAQPIVGWTPHAPNIYMAELNAATNSSRFPPATTAGINQLFRNGARLGIGRWPNSDAADGGFATIDDQPAGNRILAQALPAANWSGATVHIRGMRWYILNRVVASNNGAELTLNAPATCWGGDCTGWGFWLDNHLATLDREGEWFYDAVARRVYLYTTTDPNQAQIEGSVMLLGESANLGGVILGRHLQEHVSHVIVENLLIEKWFDNGITTPVNLEKDEHSNLIIRNNVIRDVDGVGINLATWVWNAAANGNGANGWRGGRNLTISGNVIERANRMGINTYARQTLIEENVLRDIARIENLGAAGMGCGVTDGEGACTEDGDGIRIKVDDPTYSGNHLTVRYNRLERIGYNGLDVFGADNVVESNVITHACISKGDCGALRSFGGDNLTTTPVRNLTITENIIVAPIGATDGCRADFDAHFGFGLYIDHNSANVTITGNTVISATASGILYQDSTGAAQDNILFANAAGTMYAYQTSVVGTDAALSAYTGNTMLGLTATAGTLRADNAGQIAVSDHNGFYHASRPAHIDVTGNKTLAQWQSASGKDNHSTERVAAELATAEIWYNDAKTSISIDLPRPYITLDGQPAPNPLTLAPFTAQILVPHGAPAPFLSITASAPAFVSMGEPITYTIGVVNRGGADATDVVITSTLPAGTVHASGGALIDDEVQWTAPSLAPGALMTVTLGVNVNAGVALVVNDRYGVRAAGGYAAMGAPVVTFVDGRRVNLPYVQR